MQNEVVGRTISIHKKARKKERNYNKKEKNCSDFSFLFFFLCWGLEIVAKVCIICTQSAPAAASEDNDKEKRRRVASSSLLLLLLHLLYFNLHFITQMHCFIIMSVLLNGSRASVCNSTICIQNVSMLVNWIWEGFLFDFGFTVCLDIDCAVSVRLRVLMLIVIP
jgi:hypothetical protein